MTRPPTVLAHEASRRSSPYRDQADQSDGLLDVTDLTVTFGIGPMTAKAVKGASLRIGPGEAIGLVGESGSGKSVTALAILGLLPPDASVAGSIRYRGRELIGSEPEVMRRLRGPQIAIVFQDPLSSLDPVMPVGKQVTETLRVHGHMSRDGRERRALELFDLVGIPDARRRLRQYPHQFSGGMRQRAMIAAALAAKPSLLIADEPTTALDVTIQAQILDLLRDLRAELGMSVLMITHDLGVMAEIAERVYVMYAGRIVEEAAAERMVNEPLHPYTQGLLRAIPDIGRDRSEPLVPIEGNPPDVRVDHVGCPFAPRCPYAFDRCSTRPPLITVAEGQRGACWLLANE